jgi:hypothetical protein
VAPRLQGSCIGGFCAGRGGWLRHGVPGVPFAAPADERISAAARHLSKLEDCPKEWEGRRAGEGVWTGVQGCSQVLIWRGRKLWATARGVSKSARERGGMFVRAARLAGSMGPFLRGAGLPGSACTSMSSTSSSGLWSDTAAPAGPRRVGSSLGRRLCYKRESCCLHQCTWGGPEAQFRCTRTRLTQLELRPEWPAVIYSWCMRM